MFCLANHFLDTDFFILRELYNLVFFSFLSGPLGYFILLQHKSTRQLSQVADNTECQT